MEVESRQPPSILKALDKVDQAVARLQQLQSTIEVTRLAISCISPRRTDGYSASAGSSHAAEWTQWSASAEYVHRALSDILVATKNAKGTAGGDSQVLEVENKRKVEYKQHATSRKDRKAESTQHATSRKDRKAESTQHATSSKNHCDTRNTQNVQKLEHVENKNSDKLELSRSLSQPCVKVSEPAPMLAPAQSMKITRVKQAQTSWKLSQKIKPTKPNAIMFPNLAYESASPPSSKHFRILAPFKHPDKAVPLLRGKKKQTSPVKSLPALIDRLPSKNKPGTRTPRPAAVMASSLVASKPKVLPYPPAHFSRKDKHEEKSAASKPSYTRLLKEANSTVANSAAEKRLNAGGRCLKLSEDTERATSISPGRRKHSDKENLLSKGPTSSLKRSWSASSASTETRRTNTGHSNSMLQRAKGWMFGKQQQVKKAMV